MPPEMRKAHPYYVYEAIQAQPELVEKILQKRGAIERAANAIAEKERITFVGIGTSLHAARIAESWMREFSAGRFLARAEQSFELVHHPIAFTASDAVIVITHTGTTTASVEALRMARAAGALTVAITGEISGEGVRGADFQIETCEQEVAFAYTKSYTTALAVLALLIMRIVERRKLLAHGYSYDDVARVPEWMREALKVEPQVREFAKRASPLARIEILRYRSGLGHGERGGVENQRGLLHRGRRVRDGRNTSRAVFRNGFPRCINWIAHRPRNGRSRAANPARCG